MYKFLISIVILLLLGCTPAKYSDVSADSKYKELIGRVFVTQSELQAIGVSFDANYSEQVDYVFLEPNPGFNGPEVIFKQTLPKGIELEVTGIMKTSQLLNSSIYFLVKEKNASELKEHKLLVFVSGDIKGENLGLEKSHFFLKK